MTKPDEASELRDLERRVRRLTISRRDPERFFVERDEIAAEIRSRADRLDGGRRRAPTHTWRA